MSRLSQSQPDEFPLEALPDRVLLFVLEASEALVIDPAIVAGPCLAVLAGCIGNRRRIIVNKNAWVEPAILWVALVMRSGGKKTPALSTVLEHLHEQEAAEIAAEEMRRAEYEKALQEWKDKPERKRGDRPEEPEPATRLLVSDITTEGLLLVHTRGPLGLLLHRDELGGWLRSYNQYKAGRRGGDAQAWCEVHQGRPALVDRKGGRTLSVPRAAVSIVGGIQPELLRDALSGEHMFDGIASRLLFVAPPERLKRWSGQTISDEAREGWTSLLDELLQLEPDEDGDPVDLPMTEAAKEVWVAYYGEHALREADAEGPFRSALSKLEAATARLALVIQLADDPQSTEVGADAMEAGIAISEWFEAQAARVYEGMEESQQEQERRQVCEWIAGRGGAVTVRDLARLGPSRFRKRAREVLADLANSGLVDRRKTAGRKAAEFVLCDSDTRDAGGVSS